MLTSPKERLPDQTARPTGAPSPGSALRAACRARRRPRPSRCGTAPSARSLEALAQHRAEVAARARWRRLLHGIAPAAALRGDQLLDPLAVLVAQEARVEGAFERGDQLLAEVALRSGDLRSRRPREHFGRDHFVGGA